MCGRRGRQIILYAHSLSYRFNEKFAKIADFARAVARCPNGGRIFRLLRRKNWLSENIFVLVEAIKWNGLSAGCHTVFSLKV